MSTKMCVYCDLPIRAVSHRVREVENDPDGIKEIHYVRTASVFKASHVSTEDGDVCVTCLNDAKKEKKLKGEDVPLIAEMKAKADRLKKEKEDKNAI